MRISDWSSDVCSSDLAVGFRQVHGDAERPAARDDGDLVQGIDARHVEADQSVARLVICRLFLVLLAHHHGAPLGAHHNLVLCALELRHGDAALAGARGTSEEHTSELQSQMCNSYAAI